MTTITTSVPEHSLRHDKPGAPTSSTADDLAGNREADTSSRKPGRIGGRKSVSPGPTDTESAACSFPFTPDDATPLAWWRTLPSDAFYDAEHLLLLTTLEQGTFLAAPNPPPVFAGLWTFPW
jgi:hypothetical protein